ncbi:MAG: shikimate dehydrogenase [Candidatus Diapherotrites archaeon]
MKKEPLLFAVIGKPLGHSLSPKMHNAAFKAKKINAVYFALETDKAKDAIGLMKALGIKGYSVTIPLKETALHLMDSVEPLAKRIGAINTVVNRNGRLYGYNTDCFGAISALEEKISLKGKNALVLGAGGAAKAIAFGLKQKKAKVAIANRTFSRAKSLAKKIGGKAVALKSMKSLEGFDVLVNATSIGMHPKTSTMPLNASLLHKKLLVFDIIYNPLETKLLREARRKGCKTVNGVKMFVEQGEKQFELFTGKNAPKKLMERVVLMELKKGKK